MPVMVYTSPKGALWDENVNISGRYFSLHNVSIFFTTEITCVQDLDPIDLDHEHSSAHNMACNIRCNFYSLLFNLDTKFYLADPGQGLSHMLLGEKNFILIPDF